MATKGKRIHVVPHEGGFAAKREGTNRAGSVHPTQQEAIEAAQTTARRERGEVIIHRRNGQIRDSDSYGSDPNPPRDTKH
ncbi:DUF2188 domain-containing protein [bacterium]|nr:DUF2188 domain-containing protein [bacterium]